MDRRGFLRNISIAAAGVAVVPTLSLGSVNPISRIKTPIPPPSPMRKVTQVTLDRCKEYERSITNYLYRQSPLRRVFVVEELPIGAITRYESKPSFSSYVLSRYNTHWAETGNEELIFPTFELASHSSDLATMKKKLLDLEDEQLAFLLDSSIKEKNTHYSSKSNLAEAFHKAFRDLEYVKVDLIVRNVIVHPSMFNVVKEIKRKNEFTGESHKVFDYPSGTFNNYYGPSKNFHGHVWSADVIFCKHIKPNEIYFTPECCYFGPMPIRQTITCLPVDDGSSVVFEEIGAAILHDAHFSKVIIK